MRQFLIVLLVGAGLPSTQPACVDCLATCSDGANIDVNTGLRRVAIAGGTVQICRRAECWTVPIDDEGRLSQAQPVPLVSNFGGDDVLHFDVSFHERPANDSDDFTIEIRDRAAQAIRHYEWTAKYKDHEVCGNTCSAAVLDVSNAR